MTATLFEPTPALIVILTAVAVIGWILAGYPLWLSWRTGGRSSGAGPAVWEPTVAVLLPVHNGATFLADKLESLLALDYPHQRMEIFVLSDASTDGTDEIAKGYQQAGRIRFRRLPRGGKAAALNAGMGETSAEVLLLTDVRQRLEPDCLRRLLARLQQPGIGVVSGNLRIRTGQSRGEASVGLYWRYESWIRNNLSARDSMLGATGPIYAMRRQFARPLPADCILDDMWLPMQAVLAGQRAVLAEDAVAWDYPTSVGSEFRRKVRTQAGLYQLLWQEPRLLRPWNNRLFGTFLVLKLGRLFLPHLLLLILGASFFLPAGQRLAALLAQAAFYALWLLDGRLPEGSALKRLSSPAATFTTLLAAAFCAQAIFFSDPARLWKPTQVQKS